MGSLTTYYFFIIFIISLGHFSNLDFLKNESHLKLMWAPNDPLETVYILMCTLCKESLPMKGLTVCMVHFERAKYDQ